MLKLFVPNFVLSYDIGGRRVDGRVAGGETPTAAEPPVVPPDFCLISVDHSLDLSTQR